SLTDDETNAFAGQLDAILEYVGQLGSLDTKDVVPTAHLEERATPLREDAPHVSLSQDEALANGPKTGGGGFLVPRVVDVGE
ncbi:MAG TPA: Asp-tRNA(Asn)/Glu-tRNA(Gln) amidotransferase subunit GatC, partial [bacterium]|nr:Asp-tRNA(Asn)/Glu-tRNA(Gln) amidotransferase subunit GatC [bacterium]